MARPLEPITYFENNMLAKYIFFICNGILLYSVIDDIIFWLYLDMPKNVSETFFYIVYFSGYVSGILRTILFLALMGVISDYQKLTSLKLLQVLLAFLNVIIIGFTVVSVGLIFI